MPELPEVETVSKGLRPHLIGQRIDAVDGFVEVLRRPLQIAELGPFCVGRRITALRRRAKFIIVEFDNETGLLLHLGMSGSFRIEDAELPVKKHDRVAWLLENGRSWRFTDIRRFGSVDMCSSLPVGVDPAALDHFGPEPLSKAFDGDYLYGAALNRTRPIKNLIMDQEVVVGVGNIYASEVLFRAGISPRRQSRRISRRSCERLAGHIKEVLAEAIEVGGTTISTYRGVDGSEGKFTVRLDVYGKTGKPCPRCGDRSVIRRCVLGGRSTFYCPKCQH